MNRPLEIVVGVTGGIAAYKAVQVVRDLVLAGHTVRVIATDAALRFVGAPTWEAISRQPLNTSIFDDVAAVRHVALGQRADVVLVAPATANTIAKLAAGIADDLLGTTVLASRAPLVVAPAMHTEMWQHPATAANIETLRARGVRIVGPGTGRLTGADIGAGRMSEPDDIVSAVLAAVGAEQDGAAPSESASRRDLSGRRVVVTAGGTREPIDPVRFLANRSSGKQGVAFALAAAARGADVTVIAAHLDHQPASALAAAGLTTIEVLTAADLARAVAEAAAAASVVIMAAAVADFTPAEVSERKIKKTERGERMELVLTRTVDVLGELVAHPVAGRVVVGFAAETAADRDELVSLARAKLARKPADLLVANPVGSGRGFGADVNEAVVVAASGKILADVSGSKRAVADAVLDQVVVLLEEA
ncbi:MULTISPECIES: bifunctional phosphopantothenoylcysteine decarboxylase/phosphopantothenate--cysteine ligase CoaBC [unclassified Microbacterium]|uniref:bifunctional phosphopantothenoylcysteine decarboxylase/phosphopantothenate--cysteine ligase CoaBC n=1 Tax=unclassified Microbacterium TaxID=2609290 RepID=UPI00214C29A8|nr:MULTISPECIES: bifunctional phosphopantothenoylcysteine decarboxylase/phosphopantothenate--cysteine ligase CoaBC [unclassified Microbacterium]MCR2810911.1 bifunctional phosphopantothenoylcysteine decarboxylase/phosphopantothenate--cysteine ligase CoaBC [Microbacterium sp. zg.B185]WIM19687.1 bifunctional phosphopantothenoylcysteine decarboxylase/phosphopantothenate--cysteine ligase CoaBC [Microbacterium sp. zg-B185]